MAGIQSLHSLLWTPPHTASLGLWQEGKYRNIPQLCGGTEVTESQQALPRCHSHSSHIQFDSYFPRKNRFHLQLQLLISTGCGAECPVLTGCPQQSWQNSLPGTDPSSHHCCGDQSDLLGEIWAFSSAKKVSVIVEYIIPGVCLSILPGCEFIQICSWGAGSCLGAWVVLRRRG